MPELISKTKDGTREIFEPIVAQCSRASQYNAANSPDKAKFSFNGINDYWQVPRDQAHPIVGNWYTVTLSINTNKDTGTKYHDIMLLDLHEGDPNAAYADDAPGDIERGQPTATQPGLSAPESPNAGAFPPFNIVSPVEPPNPAAVGACANHAMTLIETGVWPIPEGRTPTSWIRECRDCMYHYVNQVEVMPKYFCYEHNVARNQGTTGYGHPATHDQLEQAMDPPQALPEGVTGSCIWEEGIIMDVNGYTRTK